MQRAGKNHYATLGLIAAARWRKSAPPTASWPSSIIPISIPTPPAAVARTQELNAAHEILSDPESRAAYDRELDTAKESHAKTRAAKIQRNISQDVNLRLEDFLRGTKREVRVNDPANANGAEIYELVIPPNTAAGTRFRLPRAGSFAGGFVQLRVKALPDFRFKVRGSDLRCDLKIKAERAINGGVEIIRGIFGTMLRLQIPRGIGRNEIIRLSGEGLPKARGGRGDFLRARHLPRRGARHWRSQIIRVCHLQSSSGQARLVKPAEKHLCRRRVNRRTK